jgi:DNA-binding MarR family transcriptional regulator
VGEVKSRELRTQTFFKLEEIARWQALGQSVEQIARHMDMTPETVSRLVGHKAYRDVQARVGARLYESVDKTLTDRKANVMLEAAAPQAAEALIALLGEGFAADKRQTATAILDRSGYGPIQKRAIRQRIEFDPMTMGLLRLALLESGAGEDDFDAEPGDDGAGGDEG